MHHFKGRWSAIKRVAIRLFIVSLFSVIFSIPAAADSDTCVQGFVWREAFSGDHVCVTPQSRQQAASDNSAAASRIQPGGGAYGNDTCLQGFVWREAASDDHVCVTPDIRAQAADDNSQAASRTIGN
jgi:hypothetical protein